MGAYVEYAGQYSGGSGPIRVWLESGTLMYDDGITVAGLIPLGEDRFMIKALSDILVEFGRDSSGAVSGVRVKENALEETAVRIG